MPDFKNDIFISYAHIDNLALSDDQEGWITTFHRSLEVRLAQLLGKKPVIWRDPKLQGNDLFADTIVEQLPDVALLVSVLSPRYVSSEWCVKELQEFIDVAKDSGGLAIDNKSRVFKVVKTPVPRNEHPEELQGLLGYEFFQLDETGRPQEFNEIFGQEAVQQFWAKLEDLAFDIHQLLEALEGEATGDESNIEGDGPIIYLAESTSDIAAERDRIKRELQRHGAVVLPEQPLPFVQPDLENTVRESLEKSDLSIHMIGAHYGVTPEKAERSVIQIQLAAATEIGQERGLPRVLWIPDDLNAVDPKQRSFLKTIQNDPVALEGADLLQTTIEDLKTFIEDRLSRVGQQPASAANGDGPSSIYVICDQGDQEAASVLVQDLFDRGFEVYQSIFSDNQASARQAHQDYLQLADAALIYYGETNDPWVRMKLQDLRKAAGYGREKPLDAKAVLLTPPITPHKSGFRTHEAGTYQAVEGGKPLDALKPFLEMLENGS